LERLREKERKEDIVHKVARVIENLATRYNARVVVWGMCIRTGTRSSTGSPTIG